MQRKISRRIQMHVLASE